MSRQIKFRVWNTYQKKFYAQNEIAFKGDGTLLFYDYHEDSVKSWNHDCWNSLNGGLFTIQQFTCLLDKRGNEIYEGDILKVEITDEVIPPNNGRKINARVIWDNFYARWVVEGKIENGLLEGEQYPFGPDENCFIDYYSTDRVNAEVIGSIFENPELLK